MIVERKRSFSSAASFALQGAFRWNDKNFNEQERSAY